MRVKGQEEARRATESKRRPPGRPVSMLATYENARIVGPSDSAPTDVYPEVTNSEGAVTEWFDDFWWTELLMQWGSEPVTLHIAATPGALLDRAVLHQLEMVGRVAPRWRMVGHAYRVTVATDDDVRARRRLCTGQSLSGDR